ncbi:hypothetical protein AAG906_039766 [Vitis piasezkii]
MKNQALELHSPLPKSFKVCKERTMEKRKSKQSEEKQRGHSCSLSLHFWSTSRSPFSTFYIPFQSSESQESNGSNHVRFGAEMRKIWPSEDNCIKLRTISHDGNQGAKFAVKCEIFAHLTPTFSKYGCYVMTWMQSHGNFSHQEVISYELLEGEVFNSKFCINSLEPISMAIESLSFLSHFRDFVFLVDEIKFGREEESLGMAANCYKRH